MQVLSPTALNVQQGSEEWKQARSGHVTSCAISEMLAKPRSKSASESTGRKNLRARIAAEILSGRPQEDGYQSYEMRRGTEMEPFARAAYESRTGVIVEQVGFVVHSRIERGGCSPDGYIGDDGICELKSPNLATHISYLQGETIPSDYINQMTWQLACSGRAWVDFVSFNDGFPKPLDLFIKRFYRDETKIRWMEAEVEVFLEEVDDLLRALRAKLNGNS